MPQILNLSSHQKSSVTLVSPGASQQAICTPVVYLEATVTGDQGGHSYEWVQLSGTPAVTLYVVSNTQAYYLPGVNPGSDKVFRFYIDRGTPFQQYADVTIYATPTSVALQVTTAAQVSDNVLPSYLFPTPSRVTYGGAPETLVPYYGAGAQTSFPTLANWSLPEMYYQTDTSDTLYFKGKILGTTLQVWNGSSWDPEVYKTLAEARASVVNANARVRLGTRWINPQGVPVSIYSGWFDLPANTLTAYATIAVAQPSIAFLDVSLSRVVYVLQLVTYDDTMLNPVSLSPFISVTTLDRAVYTLQQQAVDDAVFQSYASAAYKTFTLTRTGGENIGSIGG